MPHVTYGWGPEEFNKSIFCVAKINLLPQNAQLPDVQTINQANFSTDDLYLDTKESYLNNNSSDPISKDSFLKTVNLVSDNERQSKITPCVVERYHPTKFQYSSFCHREGIVRSSVFDFDFSSALGKLLTYNFQISNNSSTDNDQLINKYEKYCSTNESSSQKFHLRERTAVNFPTTYTLMKYPNKYSCHEYCFNSQQKSERKRTFLTGLNKRARRLKRLCKPCYVKVKLLKLRRQPQPSFECSVRLNRILIDSPPSINYQYKNSHELNVQTFDDDADIVNRRLNDNDQNYLNYKTSSKIGKETIIDGEIVIDLCSDSESEMESSSSSVNECPVDKFKLEKENLNILPCQKKEYGSIHLCPKITTFFPFLNKNVQGNSSNANLIHSAQRTLKENESYLFNIRNSCNHKVSSIKQSSKKVPSVCKTLNGRGKNKTKCYVALENVENLLNASEKGTFYVKGTRIFLSNPTLLQKKPSYFDRNRKYLSPNKRFPTESVCNETEAKNESLCGEIQLHKVNSVTANGHNDSLENRDNKHRFGYDKNFISLTDNSSQVTGARSVPNNLDGECTVLYVSPNICKKNLRTNDITNDLSEIKRRRAEAVTKMDDQQNFCSFNGSNDSVSCVPTLPLLTKTCTFYKNDMLQNRNSENSSFKNKLQFSESAEGNGVLPRYRNTKLPIKINSAVPVLKKKCPLTVFKCLTCNCVTTLHDNSTKLINHHIFYKHGGFDNVTVMKQTTKGADLILYKTFVNENSPLMPKL